MARNTKDDAQLQKIPHLLNALLMRDTLTRKESKNGQLFQNVACFCSGPNSSNMLPILITADEHEEIQKDRQKAVECEEKLAKRKQEKHFDLVDQVENVLRRIEKNSRKHKNILQKDPGISRKTTSPPINSLESSDFNNNPSQERLEAFTENKVNPESVYNNTTVTQGFSTRPTREQNVGYERQEKLEYYSLPADLTIGDRLINNNCESYSEAKHLQGKTNRPSSVFSDHSSLYSTSLQSSHMLRQSPTIQTKTSTHNSFNGGPETQTWTSVSSITTTPDTLPLSRNNNSMITKQREILTLEQKRLEEHFSALQEQLMAEFQQQQKELLQSYKESVEVEPTGEKSFQPNVEQKATPVPRKTEQNSSKKENYELIETDEFPQSPFSLSPKRKSSPSQKSSPAVSVTVRSFSSEASIQEFYDIPHLGERNQNESGRNQMKGWLERNMENKKAPPRAVHSPTIEKKSLQSFGVELCTSPTKLNSFEPKTTDLKNAKNHKFMVLSAHAKGFLTRRLFQTEKILSFVTTIKDAKIVLNELKTETSQSMTDRSFKERVKAQLQCAQDELRKIFLDPSPHLRVHILEQNRRLLQEKQDRNESKIIAKAASQGRPRLSSVTMKKRMSRQEREGKKPSKSGTPSPSTAVKTRVVSKETPSPKRVEKQNIPPGKTSSVTSTARTTCITAGRVTSTTPVSRNDVKKVVSSRSSDRITRQSNKVAPSQTKKRRTWDSTVLKPIQGRISPILPIKTTSEEKQKSSSTSVTSTKTDQKPATTKGTSGTSGDMRVVSKPCKFNSKRCPVTRPGAKRSLAANLSMK